MTRVHGARIGAACVLGFAVCGLAGCSGQVITADGAQTSVADFVAKNTKVKASNVKCPDKTDAKAGVEFDCTFTAPDGDYVAHLTVTKVDGTNVQYDIETKPA